MPRYFFDIDNKISVRDAEGQEFSDKEQAQTEAFRRAAVYGGDIDNLQECGVIVVTVRDGPQSVALKVRLVCQIENADNNFGVDWQPEA